MKLLAGLFCGLLIAAMMGVVVLVYCLALPVVMPYRLFLIWRSPKPKSLLLPGSITYASQPLELSDWELTDDFAANPNGWRFKS